MRHSYIDIARQIIDDLGEKNAGLISAGVAFYGFFAIFPALAATIAIFGLLADPMVVDQQLDLMTGFMPSDVFALFEAQITGLITARSETLTFTTVISILVALWSVRAGVAALIQGLNAVFERPNRPLARQMFVALFMSISLVGVAIVALLMVVVAPFVIAFLPIEADQGALLDVIRWFVALFVLLWGLGFIYRYGPNNRGARLRWLTPGAFLVVFLWLGMSVLFTIYVSNFGNYNEVYGSLGAVIALLFWFYLSAYLVMFGGALNVALDRRKPL